MEMSKSTYQLCFCNSFHLEGKTIAQQEPKRGHKVKKIALLVVGSYMTSIEAQNQEAPLTDQRASPEPPTAKRMRDETETGQVVLLPCLYVSTLMI